MEPPPLGLHHDFTELLRHEYKAERHSATSEPLIALDYIGRSGERSPLEAQWAAVFKMVLDPATVTIHGCKSIIREPISNALPLLIALSARYGLKPSRIERRR